MAFGLVQYSNRAAKSFLDRVAYQLLGVREDSESPSGSVYELVDSWLILGDRLRERSSILMICSVFRTVVQSQAILI